MSTLWAFFKTMWYANSCLHFGWAVNLVGGAAIWAFGDSSDALILTVSGIAISELAIYSQPGRAIQELEDYEKKFSGHHAQKRFNWQVIPARDGAGISINFKFYLLFLNRGL